eukprot:31118-Pelagococcus_subviridis.AAC.6
MGVSSALIPERRSIRAEVSHWRSLFKSATRVKAPRSEASWALRDARRVHRDVVFPLRASTARACVSLLEASQRAYRRIARRVERAGAESASVPPPAQALTLGKKPRTSSLGERARLPARASSSLRAPRIASASSA